MEVRYALGSLIFGWDDRKALKNIAKHHVSFEDACEVFVDPLVEYFPTNDESEPTMAAIGFTLRGRLLLVVHIVQEENVIRLISARLTTIHERQQYEEQ